MSRTSTNSFYNHSFPTRPLSSLIEIEINKNYNNLLNSSEKNKEFCPFYVQGLSRPNNNQRNISNLKEQSSETRRLNTTSNLKINSNQFYGMILKTFSIAI
jgi:hypothetical protein